MRISALSLLGIVAFCALLTSCGGKSTPLQSGNEQGKFIVALNSPLHYFATRLLGEEVEVHMPVPRGEDPAQWQPTVENILQLQQAELVLLDGYASGAGSGRDSGSSTASPMA